MEKIRVLCIGPSPYRSRGGMSTVIREIRDDPDLNSRFAISVWDSYIDGNKGKRALFSIFSFLKFRLHDKGYDIYHIHAASYGSTFRKAAYIRFLKKHHKKVLLHIHGAAYLDFFGQLNKKQKEYVISVLKSCDRVIALSEEWKTRFEKTFGLENCVALPNGIDTADYRESVTEGSGPSASFLFLGRLGKRKGAYDLLEAAEILAKEYPTFKIYMAGDGEVEQVRQLVRDKKLDRNVEVAGWVDYKDKLSLLKRVSVVVLPSYNEGLPMAILEGMAAGKAIISTRVGAIPEVVKEENGILTEAGDVRALVLALQKFLEEPQLAGAMGKENIRKIEEEYSRKKMHRKLAECYLDLLQSGDIL